MSYEESHIKPCVQSMVDVRYTGLHGAFWQARAVPMYWIPFWRVADFDRHPVMKRHVISSTKHVFKAKVVKPSHLRGVRVKKSAISLIYLCPCDVQKVDVLPFCCVCLRSLLIELSSCFGKARQQSAARDVIWKCWIAHGNSIIVAGSVPEEAKFKPSPVRWFCRLPSEYYLTATETENPVDWNTFS